MPEALKLTDEEWEDLIDEVLDHAEEMLGRNLSRKEADREAIKLEIVTWLAIKNVTDRRF